MRDRQLEFSSVTISFFVHATEDLDRITNRLSEALDLNPADLVCETVEGHFGNKITSVKAHIIGEKTGLVARKLISRLSDHARKDTINLVGSSTDMHDSLYLRLDRQSLHGKLELADDEPIRVKLKPKYRLADRNTTLKAYVELIECE